MQVQQYQQQFQQLQQQLMMVEMQKRNLQQLGNYSWRDYNAILMQSKQIMYAMDAVSYDLNNVSQKLNKLYKSHSGYTDELNNAKDGNEVNNIYTTNSQQIKKTNQDTLSGTLQKLEHSYNDLDSESRFSVFK